MITIPVTIDSAAIEAELERLKNLLQDFVEKGAPPATLYYRVKLNHVITRGRALIFEPVLEQCSEAEAQVSIEVAPD